MPMVQRKKNYQTHTVQIPDSMNVFRKSGSPSDAASFSYTSSSEIFADRAPSAAVLLEKTEKKKGNNRMRKIKHALVPSPKRRADTEKAARVAGNARENEENAGTRARAERREERRESVREEVAASWRKARADIVDVGEWLCHRSGECTTATRVLPN